MESVKWEGHKTINKTQYRLIFPKSVFQHILYRDRTSNKIPLNRILFTLSGVSGVVYEIANFPAILLYIEPHCDNDEQWELIKNTINTYLN